MIQKNIKNVNKFLIFVFSTLLLIGVTTKVNATVFLQEQEENFNQFKGKIVADKSNKKLVFATLSLEGTNITTVTNSEGEFSLKIPASIKKGSIQVSFLGYKSKNILLSELKANDNKITLETSIVALTEVNVTVPKSAEALVRATLKNKGDNYFEDPTLMTAFYRETIKKRKKNVSLSEAVVNIHKTPYSSKMRDNVELYKARKSTDYSKLDTLALKLQGGPFNTLFVDLMKYPEYVFTQQTIPLYNFSFDHSTRINDKLIYVINFNQKEEFKNDQLYKGKLFIDAENKTLTSAIYALNITDKDAASKMFVKKKPAKANVYPTEVAYRVDYREKNNKWYYGYSNVMLEFKINWDDKLFNSVYSMTCEMAVTDWEKNLTSSLKGKNRLRRNIILSDEAIGFSDPDFWGQYNIIEPEKSIESAIKKIQRQLRKNKIGGGAVASLRP
ncbi:carboxypeptidase-like regulatory domain-containing protein [Cellulophaga sp. HaHaR_3_176]|uniref:carboxypeptidase-like regulatory domain-containing protein n=1 Tax=Cellulophaga sp. HaHaR_3_176 TaxID=1942464 RepID=UPI001C1F4677|nr:carboxypeptidase-like regulatory domain-containing protein [Cellulophaga sp. HaHaR_3_176]QWX82516.1 carboxypeptidase-like regulatory domain-containing protein [Cellulophaga sp. HaHaR_3_176]